MRINFNLIALSTLVALALTACGGSNGSSAVPQSGGRVTNVNDVDLTISPAICANSPSPAPTPHDQSSTYKFCNKLPRQDTYPFKSEQKFKYAYIPDNPKANYDFRPDENILALTVGDAGIITVERLADTDGATDFGTITAFDPGSITPSYARVDDPDLPLQPDYPNNFVGTCTAPIEPFAYGKRASFKITMRKEDVERYGSSGVALFEDDRKNFGHLSVYTIPAPPPSHF